MGKGRKGLCEPRIPPRGLISSSLWALLGTVLLHQVPKNFEVMPVLATGFVSELPWATIVLKPKMGHLRPSPTLVTWPHSDLGSWEWVQGETSVSKPFLCSHNRTQAGAP